MYRVWNESKNEQAGKTVKSLMEAALVMAQEIIARPSRYVIEIDCMEHGWATCDSGACDECLDAEVEAPRMKKYAKKEVAYA
jgi:hypothetical protein